jgi:5-methylcytosine-specific restriction endonuclease McrA
MRRNISRSERVAIFHAAAGICHLCCLKIGLAERWDVEHVIPLEMGGDEAKGSPNLQPAHVDCHRTKSSVDAWNLAKARRREANHIGARVPSRLSHPTLRKKLNGEVVPK